MTALLQQAFAEAAKLPEAEQEVLAARLLAELAVEDDFDRAIARSSDKLATLAQGARRTPLRADRSAGSGAAMNSRTTRNFATCLRHCRLTCACRHAMPTRCFVRIQGILGCISRRCIRIRRLIRHAWESAIVPSPPWTAIPWSGSGLGPMQTTTSSWNSRSRRRSKTRTRETKHGTRARFRSAWRSRTWKRRGSSMRSSGSRSSAVKPHRTG